MGTVFQAFDLKHNCIVAVKILKPATSADVERFRREASLLATLNHPRIVHHITHGVSEDGLDYLVMEWVGGKTLADVVRSTGLTIRESVTMAASVADGLDALHAAGVIHRDIKPRNLMLPEEIFPQVKILDLGVARQEEQTSLTRTGFMVGSYGYIAPEHARGSKELDGRSDLFALGCVLYECLTGEAPFSGGVPVSVRAKLLLWDPPPAQTINPDVSTPLDDLVKELLEKDPKRRPESARVVFDRLQALQEREGIRRKRKGPRLATEEGTRTLVMRPPTESRPNLLLFVGADDDGTSRLPEVRERLAGRAEATGFELVGEGWVVVTFTADGSLEEVALLAAQAALDLRVLLPREPMVLLGPDEKAGITVESMIERGVTLATRESRQVLFQEISNHPGGGAIRLEEAVARAVKGRLHVLEFNAIAYLMPSA